MIAVCVVGGLAAAGIAWIMWDLRRMEAAEAQRNADAVLDDAMRIVRMEQIRLNHPSRWGEQ